MKNENNKYVISSNLLLVICSIAFTIFYNEAFFRNLVKVYPINNENIVFIISAAIVVCALTFFILRIFSNRYTTKTLLIVLFPCAALANYFMNSYNIVIDTAMIQNTLATDFRESSDLFSVKLLVNFLFWGILPSLIIFNLKVQSKPFRKEILSRSAFLGASLIISVSLIFLSSEHFASFFRENKILRYYTNPLTFIYSGTAYISEQMQSTKLEEKIMIGDDAKIPEWDEDRELIILVVGETARSDHFSLNGYSRKTNPQLESYDLTSFSNAYSCATSTAISVPCMFALTEQSGFNLSEASNIENLLDVLHHANVATLWRDNNSDSKGVAIPEIYQDFRNPELNHHCDVECRDIGMLDGLDEYINQQESQDIVIVLHQMGNHGPAYYKRYPKDFEIFTPVCESNQLEECSTEEINNAYDNAILYTDHFLAETIEFLKKYDDQFETAMFYMSDHGESLGEFSLYLHGLPNFIAPDAQRHIPAIVWLGENYEITNENLAQKKDYSISHDNFFHTVLGLMEIETEIYNRNLDLIHNI